MSARCRISTDKKDIDFIKLHDFLSNRSYWSKNIPKSILKSAIENSVCFSIIDDEEGFIGFARMITDKATFGYLADVYVDENHRGSGIGKQLLEYIMSYPEFKYLRNWFLYTKDAHKFYEQFGWNSLDTLDRAMTIRYDAEKLYSNII